MKLRLPTRRPQVYDARVANLSSPLPGGDGNDHGTGRIRRRRPPSAAEQKRREQWGAEWSKVGAEYKRKRLAREAR